MAGIFIYGGCVTRDAFGYLGEGYTLTNYVARQSLISAASKPTTLLKQEGEVKGFERKSLQGDIDSSLFSALRSRADATDLLFFDLLSERLGIVRLPDGAYVTFSPELKRSGALSQLSSKKLIPFGTDGHFHLWAEAATKFVDTLTRNGLLERTLLVNTPWADYTDTGEEVTRYKGWSAAEAGQLFARYYQHLEGLGVRSCSIPAEFVFSTNEHKWKPDPYHYVDGAYSWMAEQITAAL